jgi:pyridine nucleotide-disulfide oxidoreductase
MSPTLDCEVAVIGAGPYGLAASAHLRASGTATHVLGVPMEFWSRRMPAGMFLRSARAASHIADPAGMFTLDRFAAERGVAVPSPVPLADYLGYGHWFQQNAVPDVDRRRVVDVERTSSGRFRLQLHDGESIGAERVVYAAGLAQFAWRPPVFASLPAEIASHACHHADFARFARRRVLVVGAGQSAIESAALLAEAGAAVELLARADSLRWLRGGALRRSLGPFKPLFYPATDVGPPGLNHLMARPLLLRKLPAPLRERASVRSVRPAGAEWLKGRLRGVRITTGSHAIQAERYGDGAYVNLSDGSSRRVDHVLLGTGYRVDVTRCRLLGPELLRRLESHSGLPRLGPGLEASVPGLHFVGAPAAGSYGPLMKFVSGTRFASEALTAHVATARRRPHARVRRQVPAPATALLPAPAGSPNEPATRR